MLAPIRILLTEMQTTNDRHVFTMLCNGKKIGVCAVMHDDRKICIELMKELDFLMCKEMEEEIKFQMYIINENIKANEQL